MIKKYKGFTLVEMLIVMGIIIILMAVGITVARYAIQRANRVDHQNTADNLYRMLLAFRNENGYYPRVGSCSNCIDENFFAEALGYKGTKSFLKPFMEGQFDGGTDATYYYYVEPVEAQSVIVCVSLGGIDDVSHLGYYCTGDGLGAYPEVDPLIGTQIPSEEEDPHDVNIIRGFDGSDWSTETGFSKGN